MLKLKRLYQLFLGMFPKQLPIGTAELNQFCADIFGLYVIPDLPSYRLAIATMIMHLGPQTAFKSPFWFFKSIRAAQSKEVAYQLVADDREARNKAERELKQFEFEARKAAAELKPATSEVIAQSMVADVQQVQT